jgi:hypothetical protein
MRMGGGGGGQEDGKYWVAVSDHGGRCFFQCKHVVFL